MSFDFSVFFFFLLSSVLSASYLEMCCKCSVVLQILYDFGIIWWKWTKNSQVVFNLLWVEMNLEEVKNLSKNEGKGLSSSQGALKFERKGMKQERAKSSRNKVEEGGEGIPHTNTCEAESGALHPIPTCWVPKTAPDFGKVMLQEAGWAGGWRKSSRRKGWGAGAPSGWTRVALRSPSSCPYCPGGGQRQALPRMMAEAETSNSCWKYRTSFPPWDQWGRGAVPAQCSLQPPCISNPGWGKPWAAWAEPVADPALSRNLD